MSLLRYFWDNLHGIKRWNEKAVESGWPYAVVSVPPLRRRLAQSLTLTVLEARLRLSLWVYPYDRDTGES